MRRARPSSSRCRDRGELWSWTIQHIQPKPPYRGPEPFEPFAVGYVDLGPVRVEARLGRSRRPMRGGSATPVRLVAGAPDDERRRRGRTSSCRRTTLGDDGRIVGVGLHPFGRFDVSGREMGLIAAREALADAGVTWSDVGFAAGGSRDSGHAVALWSASSG